MKKFISIMLTITMIISFVPMFAYANDTKTVYDTEEYEDITIMEQEEKRTENSKTYLTSKGTYISVMTTDKIAFKENANYVEIDNSIIEKDKNTLTNKICDYSIELPKTYKNGEAVVITKDKYTMSLSIINDIEKTKSKIINDNIEADINSLEEQVFNNLEIEKTVGKVRYNDIFDNTNLEYQIMPDTVKEDFVIEKRPQNDFLIEYLLDSGNLDLALNKDNSISLHDNGKIIFTIESPVMYDSNFNVSTDFEVSAQKSEKGFILQYKPNMSWLNNKNTIYPVTIDPDITIDNSATISDSYLSSIFKSTCYDLEKNIYVQNAFGESGTVRESHLQINSLPYIDENSSISNATLGVYKYYTNGTTLEQNTVKVSTLDSTYNANQLNYNRRATYGSDKYEFVDMKSSNSSAGYMTFNITSAVENWINNSTSKKILALQGTPSTTNIRFGSSRANSISERPYIIIEYITDAPIELTEGNSIHSTNMGLAGTAYVNDAIGTVTVDSNIFDYSGQSSWLKFALTMGNNVQSSGAFGNNAEYKYFETLENVNNNYIETFSDNSKVLYEHISGNNYINNVNHKEYSIYTNSDNNYVLEANNDDNINNVKIFSGANKNILSISSKTLSGETKFTSFTYINGKINNIIDSTNAKFQFYYNNDEKVSRIVYSNNREDFNSFPITDGNFDSVNMTIEFTYRNNHISKITTSTIGIKGSTEVTYYWNNDKIYAITDENNLTTIFNYSDNGKLESIYKCNNETDFQSSQQVSETNSKLLYLFEYDNLKTTITNNKGSKIIEYFDETGELLKTCNMDGEIEFVSSLDENFQKKSSSPTNYKINYIKNGDFETKDDSCFGVTSNRTISNEAYTGKHSLLVNGILENLSTNVNVDKKDATYTVSCWVKSSNNNSHASISLRNSELITSSSENITCNEDWQQISCSINTTSKSLFLTISISGEVYIDTIKVENGLNATSKNYVSNFDFSKGISNWQTNSSQAVSTSTINVPNGCDSSALTMQNDFNESRYVIQYIQGPFRAGEKITYSSYVKTNNTLPTSDDNSRFIEMRICTNTNGQILDNPLSSAKYNIKSTEWQFVANEIELEENCSGVYVALISKGLNGTTYFDGVSLYKDSLYVAEYSPITNDYSTEIQGYELSYNQTNNVLTKISKPNNYTLDTHIVSSTDTDDALKLQIKDIISNTLPTNKYRQINCFDNYEDLLILTYDKFGPSSACKYNIFKDPAAFIDITSYYSEYKCNFISDEYGKIRLIVYGQDYSSIQNNGVSNCISFNYDGSKLTSIGFLYGIDETTIDNDIEYFDENGILTSNFYDLINDNSEIVLSFDYNEWSDLSAVYYGPKSSENLGLQYNYDSVSGKVDKITYRDGTIINYEYDSHNNLVNVYDDSTDTTKHINYKYYYFDNNEMYANCNLVTGDVKSFYNGITKEYNLNSESTINHAHGLNSDNELEQITADVHSKTSFTASENTITSNYKFYDFDNELSKKGRTIDKFDDFGRLIKREFLIGNETQSRFYAEYSYLNSTMSQTNSDSTIAIPEDILGEIDPEDNVIESDLIREITYYSLDDNDNYRRMHSYRYLYDTESNMVSSTVVKYENGSTETPIECHLYGYEDSQLVSEADVLSNTLYIYEYDDNNLITKKSEPLVHFGNYTTTTLETLNYFDSDKIAEKHILTSISNNNEPLKSVLTNANGSIVGIGNDTLNYSTDNKLTSYTSQRGNVTVKYNAEGKISQKSFGSSIQKYYWNDNLLSSVLIYEKNQNNEIINKKIVTILYDIDNNPYGFVTTINGNSNVYFYVMDSYGKIIGVLNENGEEIIRYNYDAWGHIDIPSTFTTIAGNTVTANQSVININPLVYYNNIYDTVMEMYYVDGRFYSPKLYRYISKDDNVSTNFISFAQLNPYIYNNNRPVTKKIYNLEDILHYNSVQLYEETLPGLKMPAKN